MKRVAYLLIFLMFWAQFDDVLLAPASVLQSAALPGDDDEYVPAERPKQETRSVSRQRPMFVSLKTDKGDSFTSVLGKRVFGSVFAGPFGPPPLYVFMSLQR